MVQRTNSKRRPESRKLKIEGLQSREMMAADLGVEALSADLVNSTPVIVSNPAIASNAVVASNTAIAVNVDPGTTLRTAFDIGNVVDSVSLQNSVYLSDRVDLYRFEISQEGTVDIDLTGLSRNVDLLFADESGSLIESSRSGGRASESISADLDPGTYYIGVQSRSFWGSRYELGLDVQLDQPTPTPDPVAVGSDFVSPFAVSYTHLTLPTICSV